MIDPNKPVTRAINLGTPVEIAGSIIGVSAAFAGAPRLGGVALAATGLYDALNKRKGYGALYGIMGLGLFFLPELTGKKAAAGQAPAPLPPKREEKIINMPDGDSASVSIGVGGIVWVNFQNPLPPGYRWASSYSGDFVVDVHLANTGNVSWDTRPVYTVVPLGKGNDVITFTAHKYNPDGSPSTDAGPVYLVSFYLQSF